jgi:type IV pilus assembly protein PilX
MMKHDRHTHAAQRGSVLVIGMLTLVLLSLIGVSATRTSRIEVEISGNDKAQKEAFFATEFGITTGENVLQGLPNRLAFNEATTVGHYGQDTAPDWHELKWDNTDTVEIASSTLPTGLKQVKSPPRYVLEQRTFRRDSLTTGIGIPTGVYHFNVASRGTDSSGTAQVMVQSIYAVRYD